MCGIAGCTWRDGALASRMAAALAHRGPDDEGFHVAEGISLAHRRLAIVDLSADGRQPLTNEDRSLFLVFNGEIYDAPRHRRELASRGHRFASRTDGEVILHLYEEHGDGCVERLRGMFAFALWDARRRRLLLARDRLGIKPLYWARSPSGGLLFASEIKALLEEPGLPRRVDRVALGQFLGWEFVPAPRTLFEGIHKLPPAHRLVFEDGRIDISRYWRLSMAPEERPAAELAREVREGLAEAVDSHRMSDVPIGVLLSGGLDSSALAALLARSSETPIRTFSLHFPEASYSELDHARFMAEHLGAEHHELLVDRVTPDTLARVVRQFDEPMTDPSSLPLFLLAARVREHVKVCLSGEGGDELMAGYDRFRASRLHRLYKRLPRGVREGCIDPLVDRLPDRPSKKGPINLLKRFVEGGRLPAAGEHLRWQYFLPPGLASELLAPDWRHAAEDPFAPVHAALAGCDAGDELARELYLDTVFMLPDSPLVKVDKMSMAHGLEIRVPFLDHRYVELWAGIPSRHKLRGLTTKALFRRAMVGVLPERIRRRGKQGYSLPVKHWLRGGLRELLEDSLASSPLVNEAFRRATVERLLHEHLDGGRNHGHLLWGLLNLALWHRTFVEDSPAHGRVASLSAVTA